MLQETKCDKDTMLRIAQKIWKRCEVVMVDVDGALGVFSILWDPWILTLDIHLSSTRLMKGIYRVLGMLDQGYIMNSYGPLTSTMKK
jgi:hypothetical protein